MYGCLEQSLKKMGVLNMNACIASAKVEDEFLRNDSMYFHSRMGFTEVGRFHNSGYKFGRWYDMIWMEKLIGSHDAHPGEVRFGEWNLEE